MLLLYCKNGIVVATHDDAQNVPASAYGDGVWIFPGTLSGLARIGPPPAAGERDTRPYAAPALTSPADLAAYANMKQWLLACGGYTVNVAGTPRPFKTDGLSLGLMTGKQLRLQQANPPTAINWQFDDVGFVQIAPADFTPAAIAVADFVQATFDALDNVLAQIFSGAITSQAQVDAFAWPANH